jgi:catechol 2,3-dioxygenase-like lactoylglutathione lyase family enzyme
MLGAGGRRFAIPRDPLLHRRGVDRQNRVHRSAPRAARARPLNDEPAGEDAMLKHFDHVTIVVRDVERAKTFFGVLGFKQAISTVIAGEPFASYMGVPGIEAEHVTLVLENASPRTEIQLLRYRHPQALPDPNIGDLHKLGFNHVCFAVDDIEAEVAKLRANGFQTRNEIMDFHSRKLVFIEGPEGVTIELSQWH